jgi:glycerophosphoryl diester phosphodiesterase
MLSLLPGKDFILAVEVKDPDNFPGIAEQIAQILAERQVEDRVIVLSFDHGWLERFRSVAPEVRVVPIWFLIPSKSPPEGTAFVSVWWPNVLLDPTLVARIHRQGYPVVAWTMNQAWQMRLLHGLGVDGFATDDPEIWNQKIK